jgi:hypothetical protein
MVFRVIFLPGGELCRAFSTTVPIKQFKTDIAFFKSWKWNCMHFLCVRFLKRKKKRNGKEKQTKFLKLFEIELFKYRSIRSI